MGIILLICFAFGALNMYNGRFEMRDLQVYYDAAGKLLDGESPYRQAFGLSSGFYKYSASAAVVFMPFHALGWWATRIVFFTIISASVAWFLPDFTSRFRRELGFDNKHTSAVVLFTGIALAGHISRELLLGNVNWLLFLLVFAAFFQLRRNEWLAGILLALALTFKPHFAVVLPWLMLRSHFKAFTALIVAFFVFLMLPAAGWGIEHTAALIREWMEAMQAHNTGLAESPNTFYGLFSLVTGAEASWVVLFFLGLTAGCVLVWMLSHFRIERKALAQQALHQPSFTDQPGQLLSSNRLLEFSVLLALVPNLVHTDTEHFMWTFPLIVAAGSSWFSVSPRPLVPALFIALALIPYTLNTPDLWGQNAAEFFDKSGVLGLANAALIAAGLWLYSRYRSDRMLSTD